MFLTVNTCSKQICFLKSCQFQMRPQGNLGLDPPPYGTPIRGGPFFLRDQFLFCLRHSSNVRSKAGTKTRLLSCVACFCDHYNRLWMRLKSATPPKNGFFDHFHTFTIPMRAKIQFFCFFSTIYNFASFCPLKTIRLWKLFYFFSKIQNFLKKRLGVGACTQKARLKIQFVGQFQKNGKTQKKSKIPNFQILK